MDPPGQSGWNHWFSRVGATGSVGLEPGSDRVTVHSGLALTLETSDVKVAEIPTPELNWNAPFSCAVDSRLSLAVSMEHQANAVLPLIVILISYSYFWTLFLSLFYLMLNNKLLHILRHYYIANYT